MGSETTLGSDGDPIEGHPDGATEVPIVTWADGYCVPRIGFDPRGIGCDPNDADDCPSCAQCIVFSHDPPGNSICLDRCRPTAGDNSDCRNHYACGLAARVCFPGCSNDDRCRIRRMDTDGDGEIGRTDALVYDTESDATCNRDTWRCEHSGTPGAQAGDPCEKDSQCEADGVCVTAATRVGSWDGYCTRFGCDLAGIACAGDGACVERGVEAPLCLAPCRVGVTDPRDDRFAPAADCREGYRCLWDGSSEATGGCAPGNFNDVRHSNVGAPCKSDAECYSPYGQGLCDLHNLVSLEGHCTVLDCGAPGMPDDVCGTGARCVDADGPGGSMTLCLETCETASDCAEELGCVDFDGVMSTPRVCFAGCLGDADCRSGERCEIPAGRTVGQCR